VDLCTLPCSYFILNSHYILLVLLYTNTKLFAVQQITTIWFEKDQISLCSQNLYVCTYASSVIADTVKVNYQMLWYLADKTTPQEHYHCTYLVLIQVIWYTSNKHFVRSVLNDRWNNAYSARNKLTSNSMKTILSTWQYNSSTCNRIATET